MAVFQGIGKLIGVNSYVKDNKQKVVYSVAVGDVDQQTKLFNDIELKQIIEDDVKIKNPVFMQDVKFKVDFKKFGSTSYEKYFDIESM